MFGNRAVVVTAFDIRLPPTVDQLQFESTLQRWCQDAGPEVTYQFLVVSNLRDTCDFS